MNPATRILIYWLVVVITISIWAVMFTTTLPAIAEDAGSPAFDLRHAGYSGQEARDFLAALSDQGRSIYTGPQRILDTAYPAFLMVFLAWSGAWAARGRLPWLVAGLAIAAALGAAFDYAENISVAKMLTLAPQDVGDQLVRQASILTRTKFVFISLAGIGLLCLWVWRLFSKRML